MRFYYQARTRKGDIRAGVIEASSKEAALALLEKYDLYVTFLKEEERVLPFYAKELKIFRRISKKDLVAFSRQLSLLFKSKVPLIEALRSVGEQTKNKELKEIIFQLAKEVEGGTPFSKALEKFPHIFSNFFVNMVRSGESSGTLSESLNHIADHLEREYHLYSKAKGAMIYPLLVLTVSVAVFLLIVFFVIPHFAKLLSATGQELPLITKIVIKFSEILRKWGILILFGLIGIISVPFYYFKKTKEGKEKWDKFLLCLPVVSGLLKKIYVSRFAENLATLIKGGLSIGRALEITGEVVGNSVYKDIIFKTKKEVQRGEKISAVLSRYPQYFPPILVQMVAVGEKTGNLDESLMNVVEFYQKEVDKALEGFLNILEPLLVVGLGLMVGGLVGAVLIPLYKMAGM